jgi:DNA-directed RNA polymerase subunit RPC12/RpoP
MLHKTCAICGKEFEAVRVLKKYCCTKCYNKANNLRAEERNERLRIYGRNRTHHEPNTKCPTCGQTHYKKGYTMRDRIRCDYCENGVASGYYVDTAIYEHRIYA